MADALKYKLADFELYKVAREFRKKVCGLIPHSLPEEKYALGIQMRRAAVSVTNTLAEGHGRWYY